MEKNNVKKIRVVQIGLGPLGQKTCRYIQERSGFELVGGVDVNPGVHGKDLGEVAGAGKLNLPIAASLTELYERLTSQGVGLPRVALLTTVSDLQKITPQIENIVERGLSVVSTCEELTHPWQTSPELAARIDSAAKKNGVSVVATGVNPGFLMDALPIGLTAICQRVDKIEVSRIQDAQFRRVPFQQKIGVGLSLEEFSAKKKAGNLRHVGLTESMWMIAARMGWQLDHTEDIIAPVISEHNFSCPGTEVPQGRNLGVKQVARGLVRGEEKVVLTFCAAVGLPNSVDRITISGEPTICSEIPGGANGDVATCAILLNTAQQILRVQPGLQTMVDIPPVSYFE